MFVPKFVTSDHLTDSDMGKEILLDREESRHASVLRIKSGETIRLYSLASNSWFHCSVTGANNSLVSVSPERELSELTKMASPLRLFIGTPSSSVMETIVQHTTEIGVAEIVMYRAERTQLNLDSEAREKISKRLTKIAISALKQSGAARLPKIRVTSDPIVDLLQGPALKKSFVGSLSTNNDILRILTENGRFFNEFEGSPNNADFISVIIGPEGGLSDTEEERLIQLGVTPYSLGPAALRVETASIVTAGIINSFIRADSDAVSKLQITLLRPQ